MHIHTYSLLVYTCKFGHFTEITGCSSVGAGVGAGSSGREKCEWEWEIWEILPQNNRKIRMHDELKGGHHKEGDAD
jgi:hypothetical protein